MLAALKLPDTPLSHAFRKIEPTWRNYIYYVETASKAGDEEMVKFLASYKALPRREQMTVMPETLCDLSGVLAADLVGAVSREVWAHKQSESTISASMDHPRVIESTAKFAMQSPFGFKDRELFLRATGALPDKKGASIVINNAPQANQLNMPSSAGMNGFRPMDQSVIEMSKLLDEPAEENVINLPMSHKDSDLVLEEAD